MPVIPAPPMAPGSTPMDMDATKWRFSTPLTCRCCGKVEHFVWVSPGIWCLLHDGQWTQRACRASHWWYIFYAFDLDHYVHVPVAAVTLSLIESSTDITLDNPASPVLCMFGAFIFFLCITPLPSVQIPHLLIPRGLWTYFIERLNIHQRYRSCSWGKHEYVLSCRRRRPIQYHIDQELWYSGWEKWRWFQWEFFRPASG